MKTTLRLIADYEVEYADDQQLGRIIDDIKDNAAMFTGDYIELLDVNVRRKEADAAIPTWRVQFDSKVRTLIDVCKDAGGVRDATLSRVSSDLFSAAVAAVEKCDEFYHTHTYRTAIGLADDAEAGFDVAVGQLESLLYKEADQ